MSVVTQFPPATSAEAIRWFSHKLHLETDCADVHSAQRAGEVDFVLLHVVGSEEAFARRHLPGAQHLPHSQLPPSEWPPGRRRPSLWSTAPGRTATALTLPR